MKKILLKLFTSKKKVRRARSSSGFMRAELSKIAKLNQGVISLNVTR